MEFAQIEIETETEIESEIEVKETRGYYRVYSSHVLDREGNQKKK